MPDRPHSASASINAPKSKSRKDDAEETAGGRNADMQPEWQWSVADGMSPATDAGNSKILDEVGRMEVWMDSVADRVKTVKSKLDERDDDGTGVLHLKDSK